VDSSGTLATPLERSLVTIRAAHRGRPAAVLRFTGDFLNYFGLKDLTELPRPEELRALVAAREPEQMEMIELDADGLPLALEAGGLAHAAAPATHVAADMAEASDEASDEAADDEEYDEAEFADEDDDEDEDEDEDDDDDGDADEEDSERPSASLAKRPSR
jgi:hypothetical protein